MEKEATRTGRVLIDCSHANFFSQPTGIARVVLKYVEVSYDWASRVGIDAIPVVPTPNGIFIVRPLPGRNAPLVLREMVRSTRYLKLIRRVLLLLWTSGNYFKNISHHLIFLFIAFCPLMMISRFGVRLDNLVGRVLLYPWRLAERHRLRVEEDRIRIFPGPGDVLFCPAYWHDVNTTIYERIQSEGVKVIILVHDILPILFSQFYHSPWRDEFKLNVKWAIEHADALCSVSGATKASLIEFASQNGLREPKIMTTYNGYEPLAPREVVTELERHRHTREHLVRRFIRNPLIMVGSIEPKKGHISTIQVLELMWDEGYDRDLIIIGRRGWLEQSIVERILTSRQYEKKLFWYDDLDDLDLAYAYIHCRALVFSSRGEGFGIPLIEAASYGKPAVVYDTPVAREVLRGIGLFFDANPESLAQRLRELEDPERYKAACAATADVSWPGWEDYTPRVFDHLLAFGRGEPLPEVA